MNQVNHHRDGCSEMLIEPGANGTLACGGDNTSTLAEQQHHLSASGIWCGLPKICVCIGLVREGSRVGCAVGCISFTCRGSAFSKATSQYLPFVWPMA